jgi:ABC-type protease/lipase transport system fused ATPase/permease subunit
VLDEPDANLDEAGVAALGETLRQLKRMNRTVVMITHRLGLVGAVDRILVLAGGRIQPA